MKLLLDQGTPLSTAGLLRSNGIDAVHTGEIDLAGAEDTEILERARKDGRIIITLDADFHALLSLSGTRSPSVIRIRIEGIRAYEFSELIQQVLDTCGSDLEFGAMVSVTEKQIRVHRFPQR